MLLTLIIAGALLATPAHAYEATEAEKAACKPDALRICSAAAIVKALFGDHSAVLECLIAEKRSCQKRWRCEVSKPCRDVLTAHGL